MWFNKSKEIAALKAEIENIKLSLATLQEQAKKDKKQVIACVFKAKRKKAA